VRILYVSYDGVLDPLGASQVVPYVVGLADRGCDIRLISFEKRRCPHDSNGETGTHRRLASRAVLWTPLKYHKRPRLAATAWDIVRGSRKIASETLRFSPDVVHCRGDVAMAMARLAGNLRGARVVYDVRGFFADERVETGSWRRGSILDRVVRSVERGNLRRADGVVVLTEHASVEVRGRRPSLSALRVIPTCVDTSLFTPRPAGQEPRYGLVYSGSLGTWYMAQEMLTFARAVEELVPGPTLFLTPQVAEGRRLGIRNIWAEVRAASPSDVPAWLQRSTAMFFFIRPVPSKKASCPTKFAEGLASGLPVVCNRGIGDLDDVVEKEGVGILVEAFSEAAYRDAGRRLQLLLRDPELPNRCRRLAETRYGLTLGVEQYRQLYLAALLRPRAGAEVVESG
jgi:glycosyltransferase involved in cell wall biosynthesis